MKALASTVLVLLVVATVAAIIAGQGILPTWRPIRAGDTWVFENEALEGDMAHAETGRWRTQQTIVSQKQSPKAYSS